MKKIFLIVLLALFFVGCKQATIETPAATTTEETTAVTTDDTTTATTTSATTPTTTETKPYYVKNSKWEDVDISTLSTARAVADPSVDEALEIIATYNAANNDDQLHLYTTDVPIEESPTVDVYIVNEGDYVVLAQWIGLDRVDFTTRYADFKSDERVFGGILFVDKIPPVPIPVVDTRTRHEKYHVQMVNKYDKIVVYNGFRYEESCEETWDAMHGIVPTFDYASLDDYFASRVSAYDGDLRCAGLVPEDTPWRVISGQIYTEPTE